MSVRTTGLVTLIHREILRYVRRPWNTFLPPTITNALYLIVFGVILGGRIQVTGTSYIHFILPGLIVLGAVSDAFQNSSFSIFHGRWNEYIHEVQTAPLSYTEMVVSYVLSSALRGTLIAVLIGAIGVLFTNLLPSMAPIGFAHPVLVVAFVVVITLLFASFGVIGGLWAEDFDHLTVMNQFIIRPLVFFGAVFYPLTDLSPFWQNASLLNPMVYMVEGLRFAMLGSSTLDPGLSLGVLSVVTAVLVAVDVQLFKRGFGLTD